MSWKKALDIAGSGVQAVIGGELKEREQDHADQRILDRENAKGREAMRRQNIITMRKEGLERIKQANKTVGYDESGFPVAQSQIGDFKSGGNILYKDAVSREKKSSGGATEQPSLKELTTAQNYIDEQYQTYLFEFDTGAEDGFLGFGAKKGFRKPLDKETFAKKNIHPQYLEIVYGGGQGGVAQVGANSIVQGILDEVRGKGQGDGAGQAKGHKSFTKTGANHSRNNNMPPISQDGSIEEPLPLDQNGNAFQMPTMPTDITPEQIESEAPSTKGGVNSLATTISNSVNGSIDPGDLINATESALKEVGRVAPQALKQLAGGARDTTQAVGAVLGLVEKAVAEGLIDANNITGKTIMDLMMKVHGVMTADTDQRNAYR